MRTIWCKGLLVVVVGVQLNFALWPLLYRRAPAEYVLLGGLVAQWPCVVYYLLFSRLGRLSVLSGISFAVIIAAAPFAWYDLHYLHGCIVTIEPYPVLLALVLLGPPLVFRITTRSVGQAP